jgi:hypothetical protein
MKVFEKLEATQIINIGTGYIITKRIESDNKKDFSNKVAYYLTFASRIIGQLGYEIVEVYENESLNLLEIEIEY